jgi:hypothetical protein
LYAAKVVYLCDNSPVFVDDFTMRFRIGRVSDETEEDKDKPLKRGRGGRKKTKVLVMAESQSVEGGGSTKKGKPKIF